MVVFRGGQQSGSRDDAPADTAARLAMGDDDAPDRPASALVVLIAGENSPITRYASWLADTYETRMIRHGETISPHPGTEALVVGHRTLTMAGERARSPVGRRRDDCRVLAPATLNSCGGLVDGYIVEPVGRGGLLGRVQTAMRMATYDGIIAGLLSLTMRSGDSGTVPTPATPATARISPAERTDTLHRRVDDELSDVESQYAALAGRRYRPPTRQDTGDERT